MTQHIALSPVSADEIDRALQQVPPATYTPETEVLRLVRWAIREARKQGGLNSRVPTRD